MPSLLIDHPGLRPLRAKFLTACSTWGNYTFELGWEGVARIDRLRPDPLVATSAIIDWKERRKEPPHFRVPYETQPFCCVNFFLWELTKDDRYLEAIYEETKRWVAEAERDEAGNFLHDGRYLLLDRLQEYAGRCIRTGCLCNDVSLIDEGLRQWGSQAKILRFASSGLWSQGCHWRGAGLRSPGAWSRGQGWLLRGLSESLIDLPWEHRGHSLLRGLFKDAVDSLLETQGADGAWHRILTQPADRSLPDSSGTGMIFAYMHRAKSCAWIEDSADLTNAINGARDFLSKALTEDGRIYHGCPGPGPLQSEAAYLGHELSSPVDEPHAIFAWFLAAALEYEYRSTPS